MLRIISGQFKGRQLETPPDTKSTRPLPDRLRVSLFNMLAGHFGDGPFVDAFAGTGSFGLEAVSRGCERCVLIERDKDASARLRRNIDALDAGDRALLVRADALGPAALAAAGGAGGGPGGGGSGPVGGRGGEVHVVFFDPPYPMMTDPARRARVFEQFRRFIGLLDPNGFAIIRTPWPFVDHEPESEDPERRKRVEVPLDLPGARGPETHVYGTTALHWYMRDPDAHADDGGGAGPGEPGEYTPDR